MFVVFCVVILPVFAMIMGVAMSPAYDASNALWYASIADAPAPFKLDPRIGMLSICDEEGSICEMAPKTEPLQAIIMGSSENPLFDNIFDAQNHKPATTLTGVPAIISPSYQGESVKVVVPRIIGDARDSKGRFMPRYKS